MLSADQRATIAEGPTYLAALDKKLSNGGLDLPEKLDAQNRLKELKEAIGEDLTLNPGVDEKRADLEDHIAEIEAALAGGVELVRLTGHAREDLSEDGNALRFVTDHRGVARYVPGPGWHLWDGRRWKPDKDGGAMRLAKATARSILIEAGAIKDETEAKRAFAHHRASRKANAIANALKLAQSESDLIVLAEDLDVDDSAFNVANGTIDLHTGELRPHDPADLLTKLAPVEFDPDARAERWLRFLDEIFGGDEALIAFVAARLRLQPHRARPSSRCMFSAGATRRGARPTFRETQSALVGEYGALAASGSLMAKRAESIPNDLAAFRGARVVQCAETSEGAKLDVTLVKEATGGDEVKARFLYGEWFSYHPKFAIWMTGNH